MRRDAEGALVAVYGRLGSDLLEGSAGEQEGCGGVAVACCCCCRSPEEMGELGLHGLRSEGDDGTGTQGTTGNSRTKRMD